MRKNQVCTNLFGTDLIFAKNLGFQNLFLNFGGEAQILQLADGGSHAVLAAVDGNGLGSEVHAELQLGVIQGVGDAFDAVFAHHIGDRNSRHS